MTPFANLFLQQASADDLLCVLQALINDRCHHLDLEAEDGHRVGYFRLTDELCLYVDVGEDLFCGFVDSTLQEQREHILKTYGGYRLWVDSGFELGIATDELIPEPEGSGDSD